MNDGVLTDDIVQIEIVVAEERIVVVACRLRCGSVRFVVQIDRMVGADLLDARHRFLLTKHFKINERSLK